VKIAIAGSHGFIGSYLSSYLEEKGHRVLPLSRPYNLEGSDYVINLAGENLFAHRWSDRQKRKIYSSRIGTTGELVDAMRRDPPKAFLCTSAVGFYGDRGDEIVTEDSSMGEGFLAELCRDWESVATGAPTRVVNMRFGVVLHPSGGPLALWSRVFRAGLGSPFGTGQQWMSWISLVDLCRAIETLIEGDFSGPVNLVSPNPIRNEDYSQILAKHFHRWLLPKVPRSLVRLIVGEMADEVLLSSTRAIPSTLSNSNFNFTSHLFSPLLFAQK